MDGDDDLPHDFFSQTASCGAAAHPMDGEGWGATPPHLWGSAGRGSLAGGLGHGSLAGGLGRGSGVGGLGAHRIGLENIDLNADCVTAAYPNMGLYTNILQRSRSDGVPQRQGRPPRQGLPPVRAPDRRGKQVVATSGRGGAGSSRSGGRRQRQAAAITMDDVDEEDEEEEDDSMLNQHVQRPKSKANWTDQNTLTLCEIACEEIDAGNFAGRVWNPQAYKNMREKYWERAKLWHPGREFRNKMTNLKALYTDWVWLRQQTGCGRGADGEVTATADWWEREIKFMI